MSMSLYPDPPMAPEAAEASRPKGGPTTTIDVVLVGTAHPTV